jgi:hypothetical protein
MTGEDFVPLDIFDTQATFADLGITIGEVPVKFLSPLKTGHESELWALVNKNTPDNSHIAMNSFILSFFHSFILSFLHSFIPSLKVPPWDMIRRILQQNA